MSFQTYFNQHIIRWIFTSQSNPKFFIKSPISRLSSVICGRFDKSLCLRVVFTFSFEAWISLISEARRSIKFKNIFKSPLICKKTNLAYPPTRWNHNHHHHRHLLGKGLPKIALNKLVTAIRSASIVFLEP